MLVADFLLFYFGTGQKHGEPEHVGHTEVGCAVVRSRLNVPHNFIDCFLVCVSVKHLIIQCILLLLISY